jgi:UDPglucose 6-dehydrogenase
LPSATANTIELSSTALAALTGASALVLATEWPEYASIDHAIILSRMKSATIFDPSGFLAKQMNGQPGVRYFTVGKPS